MNLRDELLIGKPLEPSQESLLAVMLTREYVGRLLDEVLFKPEGITEQQYNLVRILKGGPPEGYLIREIRQRMVVRSADVPRLVDRMVAQGLVEKQEDTVDRRGSRVRITAKGLAVEARIDGPRAALYEKLAEVMLPEDFGTLCGLLERLRGGIRLILGEEEGAQGS
jgi:DNA-binding MarR family transcriptional regulator